MSGDSTPTFAVRTTAAATAKPLLVPSNRISNNNNNVSKSPTNGSVVVNSKPSIAYNNNHKGTPRSPGTTAAANKCRRSAGNPSLWPPVSSQHHLHLHRHPHHHNNKQKFIVGSSSIMMATSNTTNSNVAAISSGNGNGNNSGEESVNAGPPLPCVGLAAGYVGYEEYYRRSLAAALAAIEYGYGDPSSDDLSSDWDAEDSDNSKSAQVVTPKPSGWKKVRNVVHWSPFIQTYKKQKYPWVQLAGHQGSFKAGNHGTILKKATIWEEKCLRLLMEDDLKPYVPDFKGQVEDENGEKFLRLEDLLADFDNPCVMDCKIGLRTYLEEELAKAKEKHKLRKDMYEKMIQVDPQAPSEEENQLRAVTKPRYMVWRETISSTATLAFRIEGIKSRDGTTSKDFKMTRSKEQVTGAISTFIENYPQFASYYIQRLEKIQAMLQHSQFFASHELIGSSLLFVHDDTHCNIWMIDFAKTHPVPQGISIDHRSPWVVGNHEDGYLLGLENLIDIFRNINATYRASTEVEKGDTTTTTTDCSAVNNTTTL